MRPRLLLGVLCLTAGLAPHLGHTGLEAFATSANRPPAGNRRTPQDALRTDLDRIFDAPVLARALTAVRVESLRTRQVLFERNADRLVMPASNMKLVTIAVAASRLGWNYRYDTRVEAAGTTAGGVLTGDLIVTGAGDPSIGSPDGGLAPLFLEWADTLWRAGIHRVNGRLIGDDSAFDHEGLGAGWAWDYLSAGYAAPAGALNFNENAAEARITPGLAKGQRATVELGPQGHGLELTQNVTTGEPGSMASIDIERFPGRTGLTIKGSVPAGGPIVTRTAAVDNPTTFFVEGLRLALERRGIVVSGGAWDIDDVREPLRTEPRKIIVTRQSEPLSSLAAYALKVSQNFYAETFLRTLGRSLGRAGSVDGGRDAVRETLATWGVPADSLVMHDGSGLSRYNYATSATIVAILKRVWDDPELRGPFVAGLPVGGHDGSLELRMRGTPLDRRVQAKTGTISNVRALSGFLDAASGDKLVFSMIANNYTAPSAAVDAVMEQALVRLGQ